MNSVTNGIGKYFRKLDKFLLFAVVLCTALGITLLYSLFRNNTISEGDVKTQIISAVLGLFICLVITKIDYQKFAKLWFLYVPAALIPVALTFTSLGIGVDGADDVAWLKLGPVTFQPAEILKIAFLLSFSLHLDKVKDDINNLVNVFLLCLHGAVPVLLVMKQGDHGTALVFIMMFIVMLYSAGISFVYVLLALFSVPIIIYFSWKYLLGAVQKERILILFNPGTDPEGIEWQQDLGLSDLSSGNIFGKGLFTGEKNMNPEIHNDFIFSYVGYAFGFVGCIAVILVFSFICIKIIADSRSAREELGRNICMGAFAMIFTHCVLNIGMVLKVMPVIGIPLPFVSAGGTALMSMYVVTGIVLSTKMHNEKIYRMFA